MACAHIVRKQLIMHENTYSKHVHRHTNADRLPERATPSLCAYIYIYMCMYTSLYIHISIYELLYA